MRTLRDVPREAWVAAGLVFVLLAAALVAHSVMTHGDGDAPPAGQPVDPGDDLVSGSEESESPAPSFSLSVSPEAATAKSGDTVRYLLTIHPEGGFDAPVSLTLTASALAGAVTETRDLGVVGPPYDPLAYVFVAPDLPFPVTETTIEATVTAKGGGLTREQSLTLQVTR